MSGHLNARIRGKIVDDQTRCVHYHSELDVIAIKFKCCNTYYPCFECHQELAGHESEIWPTKDVEEKAILCGVCKEEMTIKQYLASTLVCPFCQSAFNPKCKNHHHLYFDQGQG